MDFCSNVSLSFRIRPVGGYNYFGYPYRFSIREIAEKVKFFLKKRFDLRYLKQKTNRTCAVFAENEQIDEHTASGAVRLRMRCGLEGKRFGEGYNERIFLQ